MKTRELLSELRGKTAGENQRERAQMFGAWEKSPVISLANRQALILESSSVGAPQIQYDGWRELEEKQRIEAEEKAEANGRTLPKAQVVMEYERPKLVGKADKYALILEYGIAEDDIYAPGKEFKKGVTKPMVPKGGLTKSFYLSGINDEGQYFVRPLVGMPIEIIRDIDRILSWLNKVDLKYHERIQGDIVVRFVKATPHNKQHKKNHMGKPTHVSFWLPKNGNNKGYTDWYALNSVRLEKRRDFGGHDVKITSEKGFMVVPHKTGFFSIEPLIIDAPEFTLTHPEHGKRTVQVPEGHYAALASQRGRDEITGHGVFD